MTFGQLFRIMHPKVKIRENGTCIWLYFGEANYTIATEWWYQEIPDNVISMLKEQEPAKPIVNVDTWICSKCGHTLESQELIDDNENPQVLIYEQYNYCPNCGRRVKWE